MSNTTDKMLDRYVYLNCFGSIQSQFVFGDQQTGEGSPISISTKLDDEGVVIDVWQEDECVASTWKTYTEMGVEAVDVDTLEELRDKASKWDEYIKSVIKNTGGSR